MRARNWTEWALESSPGRSVSPANWIHFRRQPRAARGCFVFGILSGLEGSWVFDEMESVTVKSF